MGTDGPLRTAEEIRAFLGVDFPGSAPGPWVSDSVVDGAGYRVYRGRFGVGDGDDVPALLLQPETPTGVGIVVFHQHNREWHLGKSEVAGLAGDPLQAIGPALAAAGITVLAPDAVGFEDRRAHASGTDLHPEDDEHHWNDLAYRLVMGDTLARIGGLLRPYRLTRVSRRGRRRTPRGRPDLILGVCDPVR